MAIWNFAKVQPLRKLTLMEWDFWKLHYHQRSVCDSAKKPDQNMVLADTLGSTATHKSSLPHCGIVKP